jgi:hypothetical protein
LSQKSQKKLNYDDYIPIFVLKQNFVSLYLKLANSNEAKKANPKLPLEM